LRGAKGGWSSAARAVSLTAFSVVLLYALYIARGALLILYVSVLFAIGFSPLVNAIEHRREGRRLTRRVPRWLAILLIYAVIVGALTLVGLMVIPPLVTQAQDLWGRLPTLLDSGQTLLMRYGLLDHKVTLEEAISRAPSSPGDAVGTVAMAATRVVSTIFALVTVLILTFYLLVESDTLVAAFARMFPRAERPRVEAVARKITTKVSAWLSGQMILAGTIGASAAIGLWLLGVPYFYVLALVAALGEMIPVVGPIFTAIPGIAVGFTVSTQTGLLVVAFFFLQQQIENHLLVPKVMERQVGVSAVFVVTALLIGGSLLGIIGALLAVPTAAIIQVVVQELLDERDRQEERALGLSGPGTEPPRAQ
jgi:predicted PurR-regulated permease PerM